MKITTALEYYLVQQLGEPIRQGASGESYWPCFECDSEKFHTFPEHPRYKDRAKCWACGFRGDLKDMIETFNPNLNQADVCQLRREIEQEWTEKKSSKLIPPGPGLKDHSKMDFHTRLEADEAWRKMHEVSEMEETHPQFVLMMLQAAQEIAERHKVSIEQLVEAWKDSQRIDREMLAHHAERCNDPDCGQECLQYRAYMMGYGYTVDDVKAIASWKRRPFG